MTLKMGLASVSPASARSPWLATPAERGARERPRLGPAGPRAGARDRPAGRRSAVALAARPHPVVADGPRDRLARRAAQRPCAAFGGARRAGRSRLLLLVAGAAVIGCRSISLLRLVPFGWAVEAIVVAIFLAQKSLVDHVAAVERGLVDRRASTPAGAAVAEIVGRDVSDPRRSRASPAPRSSRPPRIFPTASSRRPSGICSSACPASSSTRSVNTADSMIGNRSPRTCGLRLGGGALRRSSELRAGAALRAADRGDRRARPAATRAARADIALARRAKAQIAERRLAGGRARRRARPRARRAAPLRRARRSTAPGSIPAARTTPTPDDIRAAIRLIDAAWALLVVLTALAATIALSLAR